MNPKEVIITIRESTAVPLGKYRLNVEVDGKRVPSERLMRTYDSPSDAITSARHAVNGFLKGERQ